MFYEQFKVLLLGLSDVYELLFDIGEDLFPDFMGSNLWQVLQDVDLSAEMSVKCHRSSLKHHPLASS